VIRATPEGRWGSFYVESQAPRFLFFKLKFHVFILFVFILVKALPAWLRLETSANKQGLH
jgi:hypothetical protein